MATDRYTSPLSERYASKEMQYIFSQDKKFTTWRKLWIALAESEKELGLNITDEQIAELKEHQNDINYDVAKAREKEVRHDVMSHVYAYGVQCPKAKGIIHLGATSCYVIDSLKLLGSKGTTGTQASFMELFDGDHAKIRKLDQMIADKMGFAGVYPVSGQTYSRKVDSRVLNVLAGIAMSAHKFTNDVRLLQHLKEVEEPFEKHQIGSSAMAYKRNPMRSERIASLADYVISDAMNPMLVASTQWFERTLDDSANKRISIPEGFLAVDGILDLYLNIVDGMVVYEKVIHKHLMAELPFMATENIMMDAVKEGGDRQELHEKIRQLSMEAGRNVKVNGLDNNLLDLIAADDTFHLTKEQLQQCMNPERYTGRSKEQVEDFLAEVINPILAKNKEDLGMTAEINV